MKRTKMMKRLAKQTIAAMYRIEERLKERMRRMKRATRTKRMKRMKRMAS